MPDSLDLLDRLCMTARHLDLLGTPPARTAIAPRLPAAVAAFRHYRRARRLFRRQRFTAARRQVLLALRRRPNWPRAHHLLATILRRRLRHASAAVAAHYRRALAGRPQRSDWQCELGAYLLASGERAEGLDCLRRAAALAGDQPALLAAVAQQLWTAECADEARQLLRVAQANHPNDSGLRALAAKWHGGNGPEGSWRAAG